MDIMSILISKDKALLQKYIMEIQNKTISEFFSSVL